MVAFNSSGPDIFRRLDLRWGDEDVRRLVFLDGEEVVMSCPLKRHRVFNSFLIAKKMRSAAIHSLRVAVDRESKEPTSVVG